ncbi:MAG: glutamate mutase [Clostridiaceae bacterium]|nr:glutamate mutase [Clostridiaceae bacterium]
MQTIKRQANIIVYDVGSTYTKAVAFALDQDHLDFLGRAQSPTTLNDIMEGVDKATAKLKTQEIEISDDVKYYSTCSAAGGLRMVAMGFMPRVTAKAAKEVAMSAGARVLEVISHEDSPTYRLEILREIKPDIILLAGGTDGGEIESAVENARLIVEAELSCMVVIACNKEAQPQVIEILNTHDVNFVVCPNIMPTIHRLNVTSAREAIHHEFIKQLTNAKGLENLVNLVEDKEIRPTPGAVLLAGELWANGTRNQEGFGDVLMIDVGGATTDIHSVLPGVADLRDEEIGLIINNEKQASYRTVEGNLGMRVSATGIVDAVGAESLEQIVNTLDPDNEIEFENLEMIEEYARERKKNTELIAEANWEDKLDQALAIAAIHVSLKRHAGYIVQEYNPDTGVLPGFPVGRDLRKVKLVLGIGGMFANHAEEFNQITLGRAFSDPGPSLFPTEPKFLFDKHYLVFALGTLGLYYPDAVFNFMRSEQFTGQVIERPKPVIYEPPKLDLEALHDDEEHKEWFRQQREAAKKRKLKE